MNKVSTLLLSTFVFLSISTSAFADKVVKVDGASLPEIAGRVEGGIATFYRILSLLLVVVGFYLFCRCIILLIDINRGRAPDRRPMQAILGMVFAAMLTSSGAWLFTLSRTLKGVFS